MMFVGLGILFTIINFKTFSLNAKINSFCFTKYNYSQFRFLENSKNNPAIRIPLQNVHLTNEIAVFICE